MEILEEDLGYPRVEETDYDEGFIFYLKSQKINDLKSSMNVYEDGEGIKETENHKEGKLIPDDLHLAFDYLKKLIHDLDIAVNHHGEGKTSGVIYTLNGENVKEIDKFVTKKQPSFFIYKRNQCIMLQKGSHF